MDNVFGLEELWVIKETSTYFTPKGCRVFTDYDEAIYHCEAKEHKTIIEWQCKNKETWRYDTKFHRIVTLKEAIEEYGEGERESSYEDGYSEGVSEGRNEGYNEGYDEGYRNGKDESSV
jgi:flagellar biosynthesis/type III secretory pathway protein FliH